MSERYRQVIEECLRDGFHPLNGNGGKGSAIREAARRLRISPNTLTSWVHREQLNAANVPADPIELRRLRDQVAALQISLRDAERRAAEAEDIRSGVLGITSEPLKPKIPSARSATRQTGRQAVILHVSDVHAGEVIRSPEILGANRYDMATFRKRISRLFGTAAKLTSDHWPANDKQACEIIVALGGDLMSGSIHPELAETNEGTDYQIARETAEHIAGGIQLLRQKTALPVSVYSVPGNHGRQTAKPQSKRQGLQSWDIMVADLAEASLKSDKAISWHRSEGTDCYFSVLGWPVLLTHGHRMGTASGGQGFIGPMAPIMRGHRKTVDTEFRQRRPVYLVLSGHYHTTAKTPFGWANGSVVGYGEYARDLRADPEPAQQNMLVIHETYGLIRWQPIYVGSPDEGSLYQGFNGWNAPIMEAA